MVGIKVIGFCGNTQRPSKTRALVESVSSHLQLHYGIEVEIFDLAGLRLDAFQPGSLTGDAKKLVTAIEGADGLVVGSPVYKGSYSGLFKHVFDLVHPGALINRPVLLTASGGGARHCLVLEHQLRPLLGFFEACTVPTAIYASENDFTDGLPSNPLILQRVAAAASQFASLINRQRLEAAE
ncbi:MULTISPECIES: NAD(P)H-dependent oxidoreductase [Rhizobium]|uniref:NAD(P)H-dependent oxidoreductase n=1 Tax=Rhizobium TaxID=379 RepID=UPI00195D9CD5|nr:MULTISPECIES: NAD(P)H-dependent oxidoreductase [Rhizobium]MBM7044699.1 NAD(P)H-dependent oxidoreductase [Rhizobium lusitanum]